jgi:hypothetical protein
MVGEIDGNDIGDENRPYAIRSEAHRAEYLSGFGFGHAWVVGDVLKWSGPPTNREFVDGICRAIFEDSAGRYLSVLWKLE